MKSVSLFVENGGVKKTNGSPEVEVVCIEAEDEGESGGAWPFLVGGVIRRG
jgi:hypothetical protein